MSDPVTTLVNRARQLLRSTVGLVVDRPMIERVIASDAAVVSAATGHSFSPEEIVEATRRIETLFIVEQGPALALTSQRRPPDWYRGERRQPGRFMGRYLQKLEEDDWPERSIGELRESTARVLEVLDDPDRVGPWDWRGLVVGDVQSGKTAHYAGVINRAADAGYRVIIVLAGMHNVLRLQTQKRLDLDFLGWNTDPQARPESGGRESIGVGEISPGLIVDSLTMSVPAGDFSQRVADQFNFAPLNQPCLLVVKKNGKILQNLNRWIRRLPDASRAVPLLVIDDEADQASVDTGDQNRQADGSFDPEYDPKRINGEIRKLLNAFSRSAYVAYTATPFANILMHDERRAENYGADLFPSTFIVSLTPPDDYFGPVAIFGTNDQEYAGLPLVRYVRQTREGWIPDRHDKTLRPCTAGQAVLPPSLQRAIDAFLLSCAARAARGQRTAHKSMLVHVSRFVDVHTEVHRQVMDHLTRKKALISGGDGPTLTRLKRMWERDFERTTGAMRTDPVFGRSLRPVTWDQVRAELADSSEKIEVLIANGSSKSDIDYDSYKANGRSLIAIGGDKLSRGLTLEGLSVSYFLRASRQYDSLLQMGRWFGYRRGFADLCRLYTTPDMEDWFRHVATATRDLRAQFAHMQLTGATPKEYGLRVEAHSIMDVTALNKRRHVGQRASSYAGEGKIQTVLFRDEHVEANAMLVDGFLRTLGDGMVSPRRPGPGDSVARGCLWRGVEGESVADLLSQFAFPPENVDIESDSLASYVRRQIANDELTRWTVFLPSADGTPVTLGGRTFGSVKRAPRSDRPQDARYIIRTILNPADEAIDLTDEEFGRALDQTNRERAAEGKDPVGRPAGPDIRRIRGERPQNGLLILYPLDPAEPGIETGQPVVGVMISFPESTTALRRIYVENSVRIREQDS
ncbi:Z1 domain-containing protein [Actinomadura yumaensis]